jgi:hypothetical protein
MRGEKLTLGDVSRMLLDYKESDYSSSTTSSASSDTESVGEEEGEGKGEIEVLSLHRASVHIPTTTFAIPMLPEPAYLE